MASDFINSNQYDNCPCYKNQKSVWVTVRALTLIFISGRSSAISIMFYLLVKELLSCQSRVTVMSCFIYKVIRDL